MLQGELNTRGNLRGELTGGIFYGTMDYDELINKPSINSVELSGNKSFEDLGIIIPTNTSDLTNDSGFITSADVPTATSQLTNDSGFITTSDLATVAVSGDYDDLTNKPIIPTLTSQLTNDSGFITNASVPTMTSQLFNDSGFITSADIPTDVSAFTNDAGYITSADIPTDVSAFNNDAGYISNSDLMTATASGSIATFDNGGDDIPVSEFECEIVAQQASGTPTPDNPLAITGFSQADIGDSSDATNSAYFKGLLEGKYGFVDLGTLSWSGLSRDRWNSTDLIGSVKTPLANSQVANIICSTLASQSADNVYLQNEGIAVQTTGDTTIYSTALVGKTSAQVQTALSGVYLIYELATPTTPTITEEQFVSLCNAFGITANLYTVSFGQPIYGGRLIYANGQWSIEATYGYHEITGTENWAWAKSGTYTGGFYTPVSSVSAKANTPFICTHAQTVLSISDYVWGTCFCDGSFNFRIMQASDTIEDWKTYLANQYANGTPVSICFELATPVIIPITSSTRVKTISGDNNIYSNTGDCELKYFTNKADSLAELIKAFVV